jgi:hypothetical protein
MIPDNATGRGPSFAQAARRSAHAARHRAALDYAERATLVFPLRWIDEHGICTCGGQEVNPKRTAGKRPAAGATPRSPRSRAWTGAGDGDSKAGSGRSAPPQHLSRGGRDQRK